MVSLGLFSGYKIMMVTVHETAWCFAHMRSFFFARKLENSMFLNLGQKMIDYHHEVGY